MPTLSQNICLSCRKVFKKPHAFFEVQDKDRLRPLRMLWKCPQCGGSMVYVGYKFRAPAENNLREWRRIERALKEGRDYAISTARKQQPKPKLDRQFCIALGTYGKRLPRKRA